MLDEPSIDAAGMRLATMKSAVPVDMVDCEKFLPVLTAARALLSVVGEYLLTNRTIFIKSTPNLLLDLFGVSSPVILCEVREDLSALRTVLEASSLGPNREHFDGQFLETARANLASGSRRLIPSALRIFALVRDDSFLVFIDIFPVRTLPLRAA